MADNPKPEQLAKDIHWDLPAVGWMDNTRIDFKETRGKWCYSGIPRALEYLDFPNPRKWQPHDDDWKLPEDWKDRLLKGLSERLDLYRTFRLFMDICVRCGACADKCHFFLGSGDPRNMPVLRGELLRSVYRKEHTLGGKVFGKLAGARELDLDVLKEWFYYFYQCTECRRCSVFCPYGIDTAEITIMGRELLNLIGVNINWVMEPVANCFRTGNHLGIQPHAFVDNIEFAADDLSDIVGFKPEVTFNRKGAEVLFITPSADYFGNPHYYTFLGYLALFHEIGLDYTFSTYASEGGNFGLFTSHEMMKRLNAKMYDEAKRLGVKWILGGECGHMWRVVHQYMDTMNGPADFLEVPKSPVTGTVFENTAATKMVHISEFTADLIKHDAIKLDKSRNDHWVVTFHDSCNPARAMGLLEEPRLIIEKCCNNFYEMPENSIREQTFCCGSGAGLGTEENMEMRMRGGYPRANAVQYVHNKHGVNFLGCMCAIDKATLQPLVEYWVPGVEVGGVHELVGNALILSDEKQERTLDMRSEPLPGKEEASDE
jgi:Fe-S oxidoreductase